MISDCFKSLVKTEAGRADLFLNKGYWMRTEFVYMNILYLLLQSSSSPFLKLDESFISEIFGILLGSWKSLVFFLVLEYLYIVCRGYTSNCADRLRSSLYIESFLSVSIWVGYNSDLLTCASSPTIRFNNSACSYHYDDNFSCLLTDLCTHSQQCIY